MENGCFLLSRNGMGTGVPVGDTVPAAAASGVDVAASLDVQSVAYADFQCSARHHLATTQHPAMVLAVLRETGGDVQARTASRCHSCTSSRTAAAIPPLAAAAAARARLRRCSTS